MGKEFLQCYVDYKNVNCFVKKSPHNQANCFALTVFVNFFTNLNLHFLTQIFFNLLIYVLTFFKQKKLWPYFLFFMLEHFLDV